jgi:hypothetical protein
MIPSPELTSRIAHWRAKQAAGEMTIEDWKRVFTDLRQERASAQAASSASKGKRAAKAPVNTEALKDSLRGLMKKA